MEIKLTDEEKLEVLNGEDLFHILLKILEREEGLGIDQEHFWLVGLGLDYRLSFVELVTLGTYNRAIIEPREVFHMAVQKKSKYVILAHNHPGGTLEPSEADEDFTDLLIHAAELVYLRVIDHLIISRNGFYSFKIMGLLEELEQSKKYAVCFIEEEKLIAEGWAEGLEEGEEKGLKKGLQQGRIETAKAMKRKGMDIRDIEDISGLTIEEIGKL